MKKQILLISLMLIASKGVFAQSATTLPYSTEVVNPDTEPNSFALKGIMTAGTIGTNSTAIRGENRALNNAGFGVWGSHSGGGAGIKGESNKGAGVFGQSVSGYGIRAFSETGQAIYANSTAGHAGYFMNGAGNTEEVVYIQNLSLGSGMEINTIQPYNEKNALNIIAQGTGSGINIRGFNSDGDGAGMSVGKQWPYTKPFTTDPQIDLDVRHPMSNTDGMSGLRILNTGANLSNWTMYAANGSGDLILYAKGVMKGSFNANTGAYTSVSDKRLKTNIKDYSTTLADVMKMEVKSYQRFNSTKTEIGLMAQDALKYFPEIVYDNTNDKGEQFYTMDYSRIGVVAIKAI